MKYEDQVLALFGEANPVPAGEAVEPLLRPHLDVVEQRSGIVTDTDVRDMTRPITTNGKRRRLIYVLAAALFVVAAGAVTWLVIVERDGLHDAALAGDPEAVVRVFFDEWAAGDLDAAQSWLHPDARFDTIADNEDARHFMEYVAGLLPSGWTFSVSDCESSSVERVGCTVALDGYRLAEALSLEGGLVEFSVRNGLITAWNVPNYGRAEIELRTFAQAQDPVGFETACGREALGVRPPGGDVFGQKCGEFLGTFVDDVVTSVGK